MRVFLQLSVKHARFGRYAMHAPKLDPVSQKSVDRAMPLDAMVILAVSLENMIPTRLPKSRQPEAKKLVRSLWEIVKAAAEAQSNLR